MVKGGGGIEHLRLLSAYLTKDSHRSDTTVSLTGTSLCTYAIEPPCTERYAWWYERTGLVSHSYSIRRVVIER